MAYLSKDQYERRNENAARRMNENKNVTSLTEAQHEALSNLCTARHELHSDLDSVITSEENTKKQELIEVNIQLKESGLTPMSFIPTDESDFIDIDSIGELITLEDVDSDDEDYKEWHDENYERINGELEGLNTKIENYLSALDKAHGTNYAPTGKQRIF